MDQFLGALRWRAELALRRLGATGLAACVILVGCMALTALNVLPERAQRSELLTSLADLRARQASPQSADAASAADPGAQLARFYAMLPGEREIPGVLSRLVEIGSRQGLTMPEGEFKMIGDDQGPVVRYQIVLPFKAEYRQTREFVRAAMRAFPTLALEEVSYRRDSPGDNVLECRLQMALYLNAAYPVRP